jgi:hypothetical protein
MACVVNCSNPVRALAIVDALHVIMGYANEEEAVQPGDDFYLRPYAVVEMTRVGKKDAPPSPFEPSILQFTSYKVRQPHRVAVIILKRMGISDVTLQEHSEQIVTQRKFRARAVPIKKLFKCAWDGSSEDDGYVKALEAMTGAPAPENWSTERVEARDAVLAGFSEALKSGARSMLRA